eukprot:2689227-Pyramimonas_sp.AAC.1
MNLLGHSLVSAAGGNTRWGSLRGLTASGAPEELQQDIPRCRNCDRLLSLGIVTNDGTLCDICWQYSVSVGATGKGGAEESDLAYLQQLNYWIRANLSEDDVGRYMSDGARVYMTGKRSIHGHEKDTLRELAKKAGE